MLTLAPTPIGNIEDITLRTLRVLEQADIILCEDTRVTKKLLHLLHERHALKTQITSFIPFHSHNEIKVLETLEPSFFDKNIVFMSDAGMPCISDPGAKLVDFCQCNDIKYTVLPGANAFATAYAASGFLTTSFLFFGFLPHKGKERDLKLDGLLHSNVPVILYEAPHRLEKLLDELVLKAADRTIFMAKELTKQHERFFKAKPLELKDEIKGNLLKGEWVVIIDTKKDLLKTSPITMSDIEPLKLPPKQKAKLISKLSGKSVKECYENLIG